MPDETSSNNPFPDPNQQAPQLNEVGEQPSRSSEHGESPTTKLERDIKAGEIALIVINGLLLLTTIVIAIIYNGQLKEMRKATRASEKAAAAAAQASQTADATLKDSQKSFVLNERPYVVIEGAPQFSSPLAPNVDISANVTLKNIGKTPALKVLWNSKLVKYESGPRTREGFMKVKLFMTSIFDDLRKKNATTTGEATANGAETDLAPNATLFSTSVERLSPSELNVLQNGAGKEALFIVGTINYTDNFGELYQTEFCSIYFGTDLKTWHVCDNHNTIK